MESESAETPETEQAVNEATDLRVAMARIQRQLRTRSRSDVTPSQFSALARVEQDGPLRIGALAESEGCTAATMSRIVDGLEQRSLIERLTDPHDGRAALVRLSPQGGALLLELRARASDDLRRGLGDLSAIDRKAVQKAIPALMRLSDVLHSTERGTSARSA
jgi:DNA-binding MarR family transcriptional regulator